MTSDIGYFLHSCWTCACPLLRNVYSLVPFSDQGLLLPALHRCLGPLDISPLSDIRFAWIVSFVDGFLCCAELLNLVKSHLFIFAFVTCVLMSCGKQIIFKSSVKSVPSVFPPKRFPDPGLLGLFLHFVLAFVCSVLRQTCAILSHSCRALF